MVFQLVGFSLLLIAPAPWDCFSGEVQRDAGPLNLHLADTPFNTVGLAIFSSPLLL